MSDKPEGDDLVAKSFEMMREARATMHRNLAECSAGRISDNLATHVLSFDGGEAAFIEHLCREYEAYTMADTLCSFIQDVADYWTAVTGLKARTFPRTPDWSKVKAVELANTVGITISWVGRAETERTKAFITAVHQVVIAELGCRVINLAQTKDQ